MLYKASLERTIKDHQLSKAITWLRFPLIFLIIMLHCYTAVKLPEDNAIYFKAIYPFAFMLGETGVPVYFFISGFLFYYSKKNYIEKIETHVHTLLVPYFSIQKINPLDYFLNKRKMFLPLAIILALCDIITHIAYPTDFNLQIHRLTLIANIPALFLLTNFFVAKEIVFSLLQNSSFIVFCVHYPIVVFIRKICATQCSNVSALTQIFLYFTCVFVVTITCLFIFLLLDKFFPRLKNILSGNR